MEKENSQPTLETLARDLANMYASSNTDKQWFVVDQLTRSTTDPLVSDIEAPAVTAMVICLLESRELQDMLVEDLAAVARSCG